jgi:hypothetical protein
VACEQETCEREMHTQATRIGEQRIPCSPIGATSGSDHGRPAQ